MTGESSAVRDSYRSLRELAQDEVKRDILSGRLRPGQKLNESQIAQRYGVSRGPIREALRALEGEGLLSFSSRRGAQVNVLSLAEIEEIYEMRFALERLAADCGANAISVGGVGQMSQLLQRMSQTRNDPDLYLTLNNEFHLTLYRASGRSRLCTAIQDMMNSLLPYMRMQVSLPPAERDTHEGHRAILDAAAAHDGSRCAELTEAHLRLGAGVILRMSPGAPASAQDI